MSSKINGQIEPNKSCSCRKGYNGEMVGRAIRKVSMHGQQMVWQQSKPDLQTLDKISKLLNVSIKDLIADQN